MARYKTFNRRRRGAARRIVSVLALFLVLGGLGLLGYALLADDSPVSRVVNPPEEPPAIRLAS